MELFLTPIEYTMREEKTMAKKPVTLAPHKALPASHNAQFAEQA